MADFVEFSGLDVDAKANDDIRQHIKGTLYLVVVPGNIEFTDAEKQTAANMDVKAASENRTPDGDDYLTAILDERYKDYARYPMPLDVVYEDSDTLKAKIDTLFTFQPKQFYGITDPKRGMYITIPEFSSVCFIRPLGKEQNPRRMFPPRNSRFETHNNIDPKTGQPLLGPSILDIDFNQKFNDAAAIFNSLLEPMCAELGIKNYTFDIKLQMPFSDAEDDQVPTDPETKKKVARDVITAEEAQRIRKHTSYPALLKAYEDFMCTTPKPVQNPYTDSKIQVEAFYYKVQPADLKFVSDYYMHHVGKDARAINYLGYRDDTGAKSDTGDRDKSIVPNSAEHKQYFEDMFDCKLIEDYVAAGLAAREAKEMQYADYKKDEDTSKMTDIQKNVHETFRGYEMFYKMCELENLLMLVEEYLGSVSLKHKIYVYTAILLHHSLLEETTDITSIQYFKGIQDAEISEWVLGQLSKIEKVLVAIWKETTGKREKPFLELKKVERGLAALQVAAAQAVSLMREDLRYGRCVPTAEEMTACYTKHMTRIRTEQGLPRHIFEMTEAELEELAAQSKKDIEQRRLEEEKAKETAAGKPVATGDEEDEEEEDDGDGDGDEDAPTADAPTADADEEVD